MTQQEEGILFRGSQTQRAVNSPPPKPPRHLLRIDSNTALWLFL